MNSHCIILSTKESSILTRNAGAYRIATHLRNNGWDCDVVEWFDHWEKSDLENYLRRHVTSKTKWIGISNTWIPHNYQTTKTLEILKETIQFVKSLNPNILIVVGGQTPYDTRLGADYYIYGYAENALLKLLDYKFGNGKPIFYTKHLDGKLIDAVHTEPSVGLNSYEIVYKDDDFISDTETLTIELGRGCKFSCDYCNFPFIGMKEDTSTSEEYLYRELMTNYEKWGTISYIIADETINDRVEKLVKIKNVVNRLPFKPDFAAFTRLDLFRSHPEKIELMCEGRIWSQFYGIETLNHRTGKLIGKGLNPEYSKELLLKIREYFLKNLGRYRGTVSMIAGLPHESIDSMRDSNNWLLENWSDQNVHWWPLQIVKNGTMSAMGQDFTKYGYKEMSSEDPLFIHFSSNQSLNWKNEHTNYPEVNELIETEFRPNEKFKMSAFKLMQMLPVVGFEHVTALPQDYDRSLSFQKLIRSELNTYIEHKKNS
jgi:radical SAM superfamily enzyme YgiQ (UPF0313 family)